MAGAVRPGPPDGLWVTGPPRTDLVLAESTALPADLREQGDRLRSELAGRRLVLLLPAARPAGGRPAPLGADDQRGCARGCGREAPCSACGLPAPVR